MEEMRATPARVIVLATSTSRVMQDEFVGHDFPPEFERVNSMFNLRPVVDVLVVHPL